MIDRKKSVIENGKRIKGQAYLLRHLDGKALTRNQAISAKCYECMGYYSDGAKDCGIPECPLYRFMPFRGKGAEASETENPKETQEGKPGKQKPENLGNRKAVVATA